MTETQGLIAGMLFFFALYLYIFWPRNLLITRRENARMDSLLERKEQLDEDLRDLNFEFQSGKYPEQDFQAQRTQLEGETARLLAEIERLQKA
jgi:uncharacterized protein YdcH (DUF465 family)